MGRVGSWGAAALAVVALGACGEGRVARAPLAGESSCAGCHSGPGEAPPFRDQTGSTERGRLSVGAHDAHLDAQFARPLSCGDCHRMPQRLNDPGHLDDLPPGPVVFGPLARTGGASPTWNGAGCQASYCHGNFPGGERANAPTWLGGPAAGQCATCHDLPPPSGRHALHVGAGVRCDQCHGPMIRDTHVDGVVDLTLAGYDRQFKTCAQACHGPRSWPGPGDAAR